jgi:hypothetical protein
MMKSGYESARFEYIAQWKVKREDGQLEKRRLALRPQRSASWLKKG